jgi:hypothetical protein
MKKTCFILLLVKLLFGACAFARPQEIKLYGRKDCVLAPKIRTDVLAAAEAYLNQGNHDFVVLVEDVGNPYAVEPEVQEVKKAPVQIVRVAPKKVVRRVPTAPVAYSDASVLKVIASSFAKQVRGTLAKGGIYYLQLQGGGLLNAGTSFPVKIPQIEGQSFRVVVSRVDARGYTLQMGEASLSMPLDPLSVQASRAIKRSIQ